MLKSVKISNFGPINEEITFTMEKGKTEQFPENVIEGTDLLKTVLIYGKNNSGKSRFISAFKMLKDLIVEGKKVYSEPDYMWNYWNDNPYSNFRFEFLIDNIKYEYNLLINFKEEKIFTEMFSVNGKTLFIRKEKKVLLKENIEPLHLALEGVNPPNYLEIVNTTDKIFHELGEEISEISEEISYITFNYNKIGNEKDINTLYEYIEKFFFIDQQRKNEGDFFYSGFDSSMVEYSEKNEEEINELLGKFGFDFKIQVTKATDGFKKEKRINVIKTNYKNQRKINFDILFTESFGTITFLKLILTALSQSDKSFLMVIDEIERGVHPLLVANFIKYMNKYFPNVQLILPTHMTDLLSTDLNLRKDQIYITDITDGEFSIKRNFNKKHIRENMNFQKILKSNAVGGNPDINFNNENEEI